MEQSGYLDENGLERVLEKFKRIEVDIPDLNCAVHYNGRTHSIEHSPHVTISGEATKQINVGSYTFIASLNDTSKYMWADKTNGNKEGVLTILKADDWVQAGTNEQYVYKFLDYPDNKIYIPIARKSTGSLTVAISSDTYGSVAVDGDNIVLTINTETSEGTGQLTLSDSGDDNTNPSTYDIEIIYSSTPKIVTWATGSDEELYHMIAAADKGLIDLSSYWTAGDERTVHMNSIEAIGNFPSQPEQDITLVLTTEGKSTYAPNNNFIVVMKNALEIEGPYPYTYSITGSSMRAEGFYGAGPSYGHYWQYGHEEGNSLVYSKAVERSLPNALMQSFKTDSITNTRVWVSAGQGSVVPETDTYSSTNTKKIFFVNKIVKGAVPKHKGDDGDAIKVYLPDVSAQYNKTSGTVTLYTQVISENGISTSDSDTASINPLPKNGGYCFWGII